MTASVGSVVRTAEELEELIPEWQGLYGQSEPHNPFLSAEWTTAYLKTVDLPTELFVVTLRSGSRLVGLAPLCIERRAGFKSFNSSARTGPIISASFVRATILPPRRN